MLGRACRRPLLSLSQKEQHLETPVGQGSFCSWRLQNPGFILCHANTWGLLVSKNTGFFSLPGALAFRDSDIDLARCRSLLIFFFLDTRLGFIMIIGTIQIWPRALGSTTPTGWNWWAWSFQWGCYCRTDGPRRLVRILLDWCSVIGKPANFYYWRGALQSSLWQSAQPVYCDGIDAYQFLIWAVITSITAMSSNLQCLDFGYLPDDSNP